MLYLLSNSNNFIYWTATLYIRHDYTIDALDVLKACDACKDMGQL